MPPSSRELPSSSDKYLDDLGNVVKGAYERGMSEQFKLQVSDAVAVAQSGRTEKIIASFSYI